MSDDFGPASIEAAKNKTPTWMNGEAWTILDDLTGDGLEFLFGRRVRRFGGRRRGLRMSDMKSPSNFRGQFLHLEK